MGEVGEGTIEFMVKTTFGGPLSALTFPHRVTPSDVTEIVYVTNTTELENATLRYTTGNWKNVTKVEMLVSNMTCNATIPRQEAGSRRGVHGLSDRHDKEHACSGWKLYGEVPLINN